MKLSDAIERGAEGRRQAFGCLLSDDGVCALGAAYLGRAETEERLRIMSGLRPPSE